VALAAAIRAVTGPGLFAEEYDAILEAAQDNPHLRQMIIEHGPRSSTTCYRSSQSPERDLIRRMCLDATMIGLHFCKDCRSWASASLLRSAGLNKTRVGRKQRPGREILYG